MRTSLALLVVSVLFVSACAKDRAATREDAVVTAPVESEVSFDAAGMTVHGTLTLPSGAGPHPAVLLIAGSGPTDRNWNSPLLPGDNGSAALIARGLAEQSVATLRYDKRGTGKTGVPQAVTWEDYLAEQQAALAFLRTQPQVGGDTLFVAGHSEGASHALKLASAEGDALKGVILLSPAGRPLKVVVMDQLTAQLRAALPPEAAEAELANMDEAFTAIANGEDVDPKAATQIPGLQGLLMAFQAPASVGFARELLVFDSQAAFKSLPHRTLILSGEKDLQVSAERDVKPLAAARPQGTLLVLIPDADHVLKAEPTPVEQLGAQAGLRYNAQDRQLADGVVEAIAKFVR